MGRFVKSILQGVGSMFSFLKKRLPGSSRSLHSMHDDLIRFAQEINDKLSAQQQSINDLYRRLETADKGINGNIDYKFEQRTLPLVEELRSDFDAHDAHMKMFAWELFRKDGETLDEAKRRFFRSLPSASGGLRLMQLGNAKLLEEFDRLCRDNDVPYWLSFGTLLGAIRHAGFVPWDDDLDVGIMRDDLPRLVEAVSHSSNRFRVTIVFDSNVYCRQVRFKYADEDLPCFVDLFIYDWVPRLDSTIGHALCDLRIRMVGDMKTSQQLSFWRDVSEYPVSGPNAHMITSYFTRYQEMALSEGLICERARAKGMVWGIDNMNGDGQEEWLYDCESVFPTIDQDFEGVNLQIPQDWDHMLRNQYGDYLALPKDINNHFQHVDRGMLEDFWIRDALTDLIDS